MKDKSKNYFFISGIFIFSLSTLLVILRLFRIAVFLKPSNIFWICFAVSILSFIVIMSKKANKKNVVLFIGGLILYVFVFFVSLFRVGTIGGIEYFNTISSYDGEHTVVVQEFQRPMHSGFAIYRKIFPNVYKCEYVYDIKSGYLPFESGDCNYEWNNNLLQISFRRDEDTEYKTVSVFF